MFPPRFILVLSAQANLLRASLVTRELKSVASARQTFQLNPLQDGTQEFDPAQVWYLMKKVIAACFDIGRTLSREIGGVAIVGDTNAQVFWSQATNEIVSVGRMLHPTSSAHPQTLAGAEQFTNSGTIASWLLWNLTGGVATGQDDGFGHTRARAPFDAELAIVTVIGVAPMDTASVAAQAIDSTDWILEVAKLAWEKSESR